VHAIETTRAHVDCGSRSRDHLARLGRE
jgi:hypothetical protein